MFHHTDFEQRVEISNAALAHFHRHRQRRAWAREAGGQIFGTVTAEVVRVLEAYGPRRTDERTRISFRSDPVSAQQEIDRCAQRGLVYLGEWHTHPEPRPTASSTDLDAFARLLGRSSLKLNALLLLIQGTGDAGDALSVYSGSRNEITRWSIKRSQFLDGSITS
ncbi:Mov34/MPN/PAD-1 family protein [Burkholderia ubonensis]|uniref:Mov34/MPN/PAD-1 family protein n=1 Tax=Burkholderia ubonensis TaxID=101571 RepID=UPI00387E1179